MGSVPTKGHRVPGSGRKPGTVNKGTREVLEKLEALGCDPIEGMARIGLKAEADGDVALAGKMYSELAQYVAPKRKAIEHSGEAGEPIKFEVVLNG